MYCTERAIVLLYARRLSEINVKHRPRFWCCLHLLPPFVILPCHCQEPQILTRITSSHRFLRPNGCAGRHCSSTSACPWARLSTSLVLRSVTYIFRLPRLS